MSSLLSRILETTPATILPVPTDFRAPAGAATFFDVFVTLFAAGTFAWVLYWLVRKSDWTPMLMWLGGLPNAAVEVMIDNNGHVWYPPNLAGPAFFGYGIQAPYLVPLAYCGYISMVGYLAYRVLRRGLTVRGVFYLWILLGLSDVVFEVPGTSIGAYEYYGFSPFKILGFPLWWGWLNGTSFLLMGFLLWLVAPHLDGRLKAFLFLVPVTGFQWGYGIVGWPDYMALNWPMPVFLSYLLTLVSLGLCIVTAYAVAYVVASNSPRLRCKGDPVLNAAPSTIH